MSLFICCRNRFGVESKVAVLSDLVETLANATGIPQSTVFAYGRFAREAGFVSQKGRGRGAAEMTERDAANLLIAVGATDITREAGSVVEKYRHLRGSVAGIVEEYEALFLEWLKPLGVIRDGRDIKLEADFGTTLEFLIREAGRGAVHRLLSKIPTYDLSDELWSQWKDEGSRNLHISVDEMIRLGLVKPGFDKQIGIDLLFSRTACEVEIDISREWAGIQEVFKIYFKLPDDEANYASRTQGYRVSAALNDQSITGLGLALRGIEIPADEWPVDFFDYFGIATVPQFEHALRSPGEARIAEQA
jgi:hypothetical protein